MFPLAGVFCTGTALGLKGDDAPPSCHCEAHPQLVCCWEDSGQAVVGHMLTLLLPQRSRWAGWASCLLLGGPSPPRRAAGSLNHLHPPAEQGGLSVPQDAPQGLRSDTFLGMVSLGQLEPRPQRPALPLQPLHAPPTRVLALGPEEVDVGPELELEDVLLVDAVRLPRDTHAVAQQREAGQGVVILRAGPGGMGTRSPAPTPYRPPTGRRGPRAP